MKEEKEEGRVTLNIYALIQLLLARKVITVKGVAMNAM